MAKTIKFYLITWALLCINQNTFAAAAAGGAGTEYDASSMTAAAAGAGVYSYGDDVRAAAAAMVSAALSEGARADAVVHGIIESYESKEKRLVKGEEIPIVYPIHPVTKAFPEYHEVMVTMASELGKAFIKGSTYTIEQQKEAMKIAVTKLGELYEVWGDARLSLQKYTLGMLKGMIDFLYSKEPSSWGKVEETMRSLIGDIREAAAFFPLENFGESYLTNMCRLFKTRQFRKYVMDAQDNIKIVEYGFV